MPGQQLNLGLAAVAFISPQNHPILVRALSGSPDDLLKYHYIAHTSLDVIEERSKHLSRAVHSDSSQTTLPRSHCNTESAHGELPRLPICVGGGRSVRLRDASQTQDRPCPRAERRHRARRRYHLRACASSPSSLLPPPSFHLLLL